MDSIFVSYSFTSAGRALADFVKGVVRTYDIRPIDGEALGGGPLNDAIRKDIASADALIAVLTPKGDGAADLAPSQYALEEINHARSIGKPAIGLVAPQTQLPAGLWSEHERIELDANDEKPAMLKLCRTIGRWRSEGGRLVRVLIAPPELAERLDGDNGLARCRFRMTRNGQLLRDWSEVPVLPEVGGVCAYLTGVTDDALLQLRVEVAGQVWESPMLPQWVHVGLHQRQ